MNSYFKSVLTLFSISVVVTLCLTLLILLLVWLLAELSLLFIISLVISLILFCQKICRGAIYYYRFKRYVDGIGEFPIPSLYFHPVRIQLLDLLRAIVSRFSLLGWSIRFFYFTLNIFKVEEDLSSGNSFINPESRWTVQIDRYIKKQLLTRKSLPLALTSDDPDLRGLAEEKARVKKHIT